MITLVDVPTSLLTGYAITNVKRRTRKFWGGRVETCLSCRVNGHEVQVITDSASALLTVYVDRDAAQLSGSEAARWIAAKIG